MTRKLSCLAVVFLAVSLLFIACPIEYVPRVINGGEIPTFGISLDATGTHNFPTFQVGYPEMTPRTVRVDNTGNQPTGTLTLGLSGYDAASFVLSAASITSIEAEGFATFTVRPITGLEADTYTATVTVSGGANITARYFYVSFTVTEEPPPPIFAISLNVTGTYHFTPALIGYGQITPREVRVDNTGNRPTGPLTVELSGDNAAFFTLSDTPITSIDAPGFANFTVVPNAALPAGTHTATVTVSGDEYISEYFYVSFTVIDHVRGIALGFWGQQGAPPPNRYVEVILRFATNGALSNVEADVTSESTYYWIIEGAEIWEERVLAGGILDGVLGGLPVELPIEQRHLWPGGLYGAYVEAFSRATITINALRAAALDAIEQLP